MALIDMIFMGTKHFAKFQNMIKALEIHNYERAADELLESFYAKQVGRRANDLAEIIRSGKIA